MISKSIGRTLVLYYFPCHHCFFLWCWSEVSPQNCLKYFATDFHLHHLHLYGIFRKFTHLLSSVDCNIIMFYFACVHICLSHLKCVLYHKLNMYNISLLTCYSRLEFIHYFSIRGWCSPSQGWEMNTCMSALVKKSTAPNSDFKFRCACTMSNH